MSRGPVSLRVFALPSDPDERGQTPNGVVEARDASALPSSVTLEPSGECSLRHGGLTEQGGLRACLACGHPELFTQKDFPRSVGIAVVVIAAVLAPATSYVSLGVAALIDAVLFHTARDVVVCYVCATEHRRFLPDPRHPRFDREIEERRLYGTKAVMGRSMRPGGTADAPEPEH